MKIKSIRIKNFRTFKDETIFFDDYTCFVGSNGAGKSTVLNALNVFFRQSKDSKTDLSKLSIDDFHHKNTKQPIVITVTFNNLSDAVKKALLEYIYQDELIITAKAEFDEKIERAEVKQFGVRKGINDFQNWFNAKNTKKSASTQNKVFSEIQEKYPNIEYDKTINSLNIGDILRKYEVENFNQCTLIEYEDQFYGFSRGANRLAPFIQWVFVSASKDASEEAEETKVSALGQLLSRAIRAKVNFSEKVNGLRDSLKKDYQKMLDDEQAVLSDLSSSLENKLKLWANPNATAKVEWKQDSDKSIKVEEPLAHILLGEKGFESDLARFGHGMQRSYLLTLLQELAEIEEQNAPTLVMAIEEPELYQHPPQARYLSEVLQNLANDKAQIMVCSHSPYFIPGDNFDAVRIVREEGTPTYSKVSYLQYADLAIALENAGEKAIKEQGMLAKLFPVLRPEISEMFFCRKLVLVEGIEDVAYLTTYLHLTEKINEFRRLGFHIIPVGGKSEIIKPLAIASLLNIPTFVVCDADTNKDRECEVPKHKKDNAAILHLLNINTSLNWPDETIARANLRMWKTNITDAIENELGEKWKDYRDNKAYEHYEKPPGGLNKNPLAVSWALESAWKANLKSQSLISLINDILAL